MSRRRILIDGYNLALEAGTGVATYARNLSQQLHALDHEVHVLYGTRAGSTDPLLREIGFFDTQRKRNPVSQWLRSARGWFASSLGASALPVPVSGKVVIRHLQDRLPYFDRLWNATDLFSRATSHHRYFFNRRLEVRMPERPDIAHWTYPMPVHVPGAKNIYTLHDLVPLRLPYTTLDVKRHYVRLVRMLAARADHIVTVSENSRRDIINLLGVPEDRVTNTYQAVELPRQYLDKPEDIVRREIEGGFDVFYKDYFLFYGAIEPKKNLARLIEAYLGSRVQSPLVILGKEAWQSKEELRLLDEVMLERRRVIRIEYAPLSLLISLLRGAKALLFPSLYEGFGLPVLEAMSLGIPVMTSTESSLPEVAGDAALYVDPYNPQEMAEGIRALDADEQLRGELSDKGRQQAAKFSAESYRKRLAELYARL